jgi:DNA-binding MarR family transcriptional regulator
MLVFMPRPLQTAHPAPSAEPADEAVTVLPDASPDRLGLEIADVVSQLRRAMRRAARAAGPGGALPGRLSVAQLELLSCLADNPGAQPGQVARLLRLAPSSVATLVHGLTSAGLVSRTRGQPDRRTASLVLTAEGAATVGRWQTINERIVQAAIAGLGPASRGALDAALPGLRELTGAVDALADDAPDSRG